LQEQKNIHKRLAIECWVAYSQRQVVRICLMFLTHCGRVTQICVFTLQLCKTDDANLRF